MPPAPPVSENITAYEPLAHLAPYPSNLPCQLNLSLFPLDITTYHSLRSGKYNALTSNPSLKDSPLTSFMTAFLTSTFAKMASLHHGHEGDDISLSLHDPLCVWYLIRKRNEKYQMKLSEPLDIRVETSGQWTRGMYVVDRRDRKKMPGKTDEPMEKVGDAGLWLDDRAGNRIRVAMESSEMHTFGEEMIKQILGL
jgi:inosine-uridine nucleoside N-ribohydrolase